MAIFDGMRYARCMSILASVDVSKPWSNVSYVNNSTHCTGVYIYIYIFSIYINIYIENCSSLNGKVPQFCSINFFLLLTTRVERDQP